MANKKRPPVLTNFAIMLVLTAWGVDFTLRVHDPTRGSNSSLDTMLLSVLGFLLAGRSAQGGGEDEDDKDKGDKDKGGESK